jgi:RHS repeat-associated protein
MQTVGKQASPTGKDIVSIMTYDEAGREVKKYLPYVATTSDGSYNTGDESAQLAFYTSANNISLKLPQDNKPFDSIVYEASPLSRVLKQFGPGVSWRPDHAASSCYLLNTANEVPLWVKNGIYITQSGSYASVTLYKTQTTDENGHNSWEFKDKQGKVVLKRVEDDYNPNLNTYYLYDDFDRLAYVIPPKAAASSYSETDDAFNELIYAYRYDEKGRMTEKHIPGAGWVNMVYNKIDQLILSQDAKQQASGTWIFSKYDALGRIVLTGSVVNSNPRSTLQSLADGQVILWETRNYNATDSYCYSSGAYPKSSNYENGAYTVLTVNYYDTYGFDDSVQAYEQALDNPLNSNMTTGLLTGSKVKVLDDTGTWLTSVTYYDDKGRPLQVSTKNILGSWDKTISQYDFTGKVLQSLRTHDALTIKNSYTYDHAGRKKEVYQQTGGDPAVELAQYNYNELGQLIKKNLHGDNTSKLQGINYRYNIRGWLTSINNAKLDNDGVLNDEDHTAFGEELSYNNTFTAGSVPGPVQWNGNISGMKWKTKDPSVSYSSKNVSAYTFQYDKLNRLKLANFGSGNNGASWSEEDGAYNEQLSYDEMGNITTLLRNSVGYVMDDLSYDYFPGSNKLRSVSNNTINPGGFVDGNLSNDDYSYDASGNLTSDLNKGLTIDYNYLNLPKTVSSAAQGKSIGYTYDATGKKLKKTFDSSDHYYFDGIEYDGSTLLFAMTEEGRVRPNTDPNATSAFTYDYFLKDHLGNVRVVLGTGSAGQSMVYPAATMETMTSATESTYYTNLDKVRSFTPVGFKSLKKNEKVAHLKGTDPNRQIGPSITIRVNSGDTVSLTAQSFYPDNTGTQRTGLAETALSQLVNALINPSGLVGKGRAIAIERLKAQGLEKSTGYSDMMNKLPKSDYGNENNRPKAYMVWMLFDKEMKLVKTGRSSGARQIPEGAGQVKQMAESGIVMDQGGFLTAYTVNESPASVYIDNFQITTTSGQLMEENTYYPFGMLNEMQSNQSYNDPVNNYKYNGKELQNELSLGWLDYGARFYDPVIGRWHSVDPMAEKDRRWSPYSYGFNDPLRFDDPDGMWPGQGFLTDFYNSAKSSYTGFFKSAYNTVTNLDKLSLKDVGNMALNSHPLAIAYNNVKTEVKAVKAIVQGDGKTLGTIAGNTAAVATTVLATEGIGEGVTALKGTNTVPIVMDVTTPNVAATPNILEEAAVHGNSLKSTKPTWGYELYSNDGTFLKNGITSEPKPESRYSKSFMSDKYMKTQLFPNRRTAFDWEYNQNLNNKGPLNKNNH